MSTAAVSLSVDETFWLTVARAVEQHVYIRISSYDALLEESRMFVTGQMLLYGRSSVSIMRQLFSSYQDRKKWTYTHETGR